MRDLDIVAERETVSEFIEHMVETSDSEGAVVGLSGGIDSTVVAEMAVEAIGSEKVLGLNMPASPSKSENMSDADRIASSLDIEYEKIHIENIVSEITRLNPEADQTSIGNVRARVRGVILYYFANSSNYLVLGTGNKTEAMLGYFTKYGDQAVDCNPIGDLYKTEVRQLARELDVDERIITKEPTAGIWGGQTDEDELGYSYPTLDKVLNLIIEEECGVREVAQTIDPISTDDVRNIVELVEKSKHKRRTPPTPSQMQD